MSPAEDETATPTISMAALVRQKARTPMALRILSPTLKVFPLGSNDDNLERAQARAARIASIRRKSVAAAGPASPPFHSNLLNHDQIMDLLNNCLKLASENKINQKNTWELNLIDHLSDIIQTKPEVDDAETNFQKASCTLEAGVKIYSLRVDSLHSEAYKVLGGINRVGREHENENLAEGNHMHDMTEQEEILSRKEVERRKLSPLSTLETSFEALNIKKFDVAFTVDPLYHKTSAQFDEGGAKGLLLNNLGICGSCRILFDSFEVPEKCILNDTESDKSDMIDLSFAKEYLDQMLINMPKKTDISPTLRDIMDQFGECNHWLHNELSVEEHSIGHSETDDMDHPNLVGNFCPDASDHDDHISVLDDNSRSANSDFCSHREDIGDYLFHDIDYNIRVDEIVDFLSFGLGFTSKTNAWAGPDYWKYKKSKGSEEVINFVEKQEIITKKSKVKKLVSDIDFSKSIDMEFPNIFDPPKNPKSLLLPTKRASYNIRLPEDCHYKPESLTKLFLLPEVMCFGKKSRKLHDDPGERNDDFVSGASWDKDSVNNDQCDDENFNSDMDDLGSLVRLPRQVNKVDIHYDKISKQVDVHALKESLWASIHSSVETFDREGSQTPVSLKQVMHRLRDISPTDSQKDISPHLFFICLLHLANEHTLTLNHHSDFDDVDIIVSDPSFVK